MARPRYRINRKDWLDCLDWLDHQLSLPDWVLKEGHPIHSFGLMTLRDCLNQWREVKKPTDELCDSVQEILEASFTIEDWGRLRKSLSARKRRRQEARIDEKPINITLTPSAHQMLVEFRDLSSSATFSEAVESAIRQALVELQHQQEHDLTKTLLNHCQSLKASELIAQVERYLQRTEQKRSLANSCNIAHQLFLKRPDRSSLQLVRDRFIEDLIWNQVHLKISYQSLGLFSGDSAVVKRPD